MTTCVVSLTTLDTNDPAKERISAVILKSRLKTIIQDLFNKFAFQKIRCSKNLQFDKLLVRIFVIRKIDFEKLTQTVFFPHLVSFISDIVFILLPI